MPHQIENNHFFTPSSYFINKKKPPQYPSIRSSTASLINNKRYVVYYLEAPEFFNPLLRSHRALLSVFYNVRTQKKTCHHLRKKSKKKNTFIGAIFFASRTLFLFLLLIDGRWKKKRDVCFSSPLAGYVGNRSVLDVFVFLCLNCLRHLKPRMTRHCGKTTWWKMMMELLACLYILYICSKRIRSHLLERERAVQYRRMLKNLPGCCCVKKKIKTMRKRNNEYDDDMYTKSTLSYQ